MDILDEIDASLQEKRSKWNYTPMREKSETDAIIDELLREFSAGSSSQTKSRQYSSGRAQTARAAEPVRSVTNEERRERLEYNAAKGDMSRRGIHDPAADDADDNEKYNQYVAEKYAPAEYEDDEYDDDEYYDDADDEDYDGKGGSDGDLESFMESENDGEMGDLRKIPVSAFVKTILKILVLAAFGAFAVVGIINTVSVGYDKFVKSSDSAAGSDSLKEQLQSVIYPLIVTDTKEFADASELTDEELVNIGVWEIVINGNKSVFKDEDSDEYLLPQDQMDYVINKLFGDGVEFSHTSSEIDGIEITYDEQNKQYIIPEDTDLYTYYPVVTDIAEAGDTYTVYADCYTSSPSWDSGRSEPSKRVMITLNKTADYYNITSLKNIPVE